MCAKDPINSAAGWVAKASAWERSELCLAGCDYHSVPLYGPQDLTGDLCEPLYCQTLQQQLPGLSHILTGFNHPR